MITQEQLASIVPLTNREWGQAVERAERRIRGMIGVKPELHTYINQASLFPPVWRRLGIVVLIIVTVAAFAISAGRQVIAFDIISAPLVSNYGNRITSLYVSISIICGLLLSELGVILFGYGSRIIADSATWKGVLRFFQVVSVLIALGGNLTIFQLTSSPDTRLYDLLITIAAPSIVIGVGVIVEHLAAQAATIRHNALTAYQVERDKHRAYDQHPAQHPQWLNELGQAVFGLLRDRALNREVIDQAIEDDPDSYGVIVFREYRRHTFEFNPGRISMKLPRETPETVKREISITPVSTETDDISQLDRAVLFLNEHDETVGNMTLDQLTAWCKDAGVSLSRSTLDRARKARRMRVPENPILSRNGHHLENHREA